MKYLSFLLIPLSLTLISCNHQQTPATVVEEYLSAIDNLNYEKAEKLLVPTEENINSLENIKKIAGQMTKSQKEEYISAKKNYHFKEEGASSDAASIIATNNQGDYTAAIEFELVKKDGKWLIKKIRSN